MNSFHGVARVAVVALGVAGAVAAAALPMGREPKVSLDAAVGLLVMLAGKTQTAFVKVGLTGFDLPSTGERTPLNLSIIVDRSGSMGGGKLDRAVEAACMAVDRLGPEDVVSVVAYDDVVEVVVPATPAGEKEGIKQRIRTLTPRGSTALFAGVSKGLEELRKSLGTRRISRALLLSDGQANVGPSSPAELGRLGEAAAKSGISITTIGIGLGYNEDLMVQLASRSDGNHAFVERAEELARIFQLEMGDVLSAVARDVIIKVRFQDGVRGLRVLNRDVDMDGSMAVFKLNQLYSKQEKFFLFEVDMPATLAGSQRNLAQVEVEYENLVTRRTERLASAVKVSFTSDLAAVERGTNGVVMVAATEAIGTLENRRATQLRDEGKVEEARVVLLKNAEYLEKAGDKLKSSKLQSIGADNKVDADNLDDDNWGRQRKNMRRNQYVIENQQSYH